MPGRMIDRVLLDAKSAADSTGIGAVNVADCANVVNWGIYTEFDHTSAAGTVLIETASSETYAGTWAILATITWAAIDKCHYTALAQEALRAIRARISSAVTSGTVTVRIVGNQG